MSSMKNWFDEARLGLFVHWGHCSQAGGELSWPLVFAGRTLADGREATVDDYHASAETFRPQPNSPRAWLELAKRAGMRYAVFTTRHHDGFSMFHTKHSNFSIEHAPYRGDIVREYVDAARELGLMVGFYYSLSDWHHPDYPAFTDGDRPYNFLKHRRSAPEQWKRYIEYMHGQVRELLTNYGRIDLIWFDGHWERSQDEWRVAELEHLVRSLQPEILINDRMTGSGDYSTPEQFVPAQPPDGRWETCMTMNESWGYNPKDTEYKSARDLVRIVAETAGRGGNLLLNVSPMGNGALPAEQVERLEALASWLAGYGESIFGTDAGLEPWQFYGPTTRRGNRVYLHVLMRPYESVTVRGIRIRRVQGAHELRSGRKLDFRTHCPAADRVLNPDPIGEVTISVPEDVVDALATVIALDVEPEEAPSKVAGESRG